MSTGIDPNELKGRKLGRVLTKMGKVTRDQVHEALTIQQTRKVPIGQLLIELGHCTEADIAAALAGQAGMAYLDLTAVNDLPQEAVSALPAENAKTYQIVPIEFNPVSKRLKIAMKSADNFRAVDDLRLLMGFKVDAVVSDTASIDRLLSKYFSKTESMTDVVSSLAGDTKFKGLEGRSDASIDLDAVLEAASDNQVIKLLNLVLLQAIKDKASDIHFEPFENEFKMRYRIDGVLYEMVPPPKHLGPAITSRVKVMSNLDIAERRLPQDGRIELNVGGNQVDMRVSVLPTMFGESVVIRVLDRTVVQLDLDKIGMEPEMLQSFRELIKKPNGIILITGPTGAGKTTTLYSALNELNDISEKIITTEDPVEYDIDGILQIPINADIGVTFAACLRAILRHDPDKILVGEIRDLETAQIAVQASLTGHIVFSTLHTNDAPSTITRMRDMGLEPYLITATVEGIMAQRLVRKICVDCRTDYEPSPEVLMELNLKPAEVVGKKFYYGRGCDRCNNTGHRGRTGIYEFMPMTDEIRDLVIANASTEELRAAARKYSMSTLREAGLRALYAGVTTVEEVVRETVMEDEI